MRNLNAPIAAAIIILNLSGTLFSGVVKAAADQGGKSKIKSVEFKGSGSETKTPGIVKCYTGHEHGAGCAGFKLENSNLVIVYGKAGGAEYEEIKRKIKESAIFETLVEHLNVNIKLPSELRLRLCMLGEENACYDGEKKEILISYELLKCFLGLVESEKDLSEDEKAELFVDLTFFVTLHELGHALIDIFDLPITGKEEDFADRLASWIILKTFGDDDHQAVLALVNVSEWFLAEFDSARLKVKDIKFAGSHSLDPQRFYNIITWVYGFNPNAANAALRRNIEDVLPEKRINFAEGEFESMSKSFVTLLEKYLK